MYVYLSVVHDKPLLFGIHFTEIIVTRVCNIITRTLCRTYRTRVRHPSIIRTPIRVQLVTGVVIKMFYNIYIVSRGQFILFSYIPNVRSFKYYTFYEIFDSTVFIYCAIASNQLINDRSCHVRLVCKASSRGGGNNIYSFDPRTVFHIYHHHDE